jgi:Na+/proline symporter
MWNYIALAFYIAILGILIFIASKRKSNEDFLVASREAGWKILAVSIFASIISSYNIVVGLSFSYLFGPWVIVIYGGALVAFIVIYYLAKNQNREIVISENHNSIVDFLIVKFGKLNASIFNLFLMLVLFIFISLQFFINTTIFSSIIGWDKYTSTLVVGIIVFLYILKGGLKIEIFTDVFQGILMLLFLGLVFMVDTSKISKETIIPLLKDKTLIIGAFSIGISQFLTLLVQPEMWQRVYAAKSLKHLKKGFIYSWVLIIAFVIPIIIIGLASRANGNIDNPNNLFYDILKSSSPKWFLPFISVALFAAFMSTLDSSLFALSTQLGKYGFWIKPPEQKKQKETKVVVKDIRIALIIVTVLTLAASLLFSNFLTSVLQLISLLTVISIVVLFSLLLKISQTETLISSIIAISSFFIAVFGDIITSEPYTILYPSVFTLLYIFTQHFIVWVYNKAK